MKPNKDIRRISEAVRKSETQRQAYIPPSNLHSPSGEGMWGRLTYVNTAPAYPAQRKWSWTHVEMDSTGSYVDTDMTCAYNGNNYALEISRSNACIYGDIVWMYPARARNHFIFDYRQHAGVVSGVTSGLTSARGDKYFGYGYFRPYYVDSSSEWQVDASRSYVFYNTYYYQIAEGGNLQVEWRWMNGLEGAWFIISLECPPD